MRSFLSFVTLLCLSCGAMANAPARSEMLLDRTRILTTSGLCIDGEAQGNGAPQATYTLAAVTVPSGGWKLHTITVYMGSQGADWPRISSARLNIVRKEGDQPDAKYDPRNGQIVHVTTLKQGSRVAVRADGLDIALAGGEYWVGLTPIYHLTTPPGALHWLVNDYEGVGFEDAARTPANTGVVSANDFYYGKDWKLLGQATGVLAGDHIAIRLEGQRLARGRRSMMPATGAEPTPRLLLRAVTFDPLRGVPQAPAELRARTDGRLRIVQFRRTVDQTCRAALIGHGLRLLQYLPENAYIVAGSGSSLVALRQLPEVRWAGAYQPAYRIDPNVFPERVVGKSSSGGEMREPLQEARNTRDINILLFDGERTSKARVLARIRALGGTVPLTPPPGRCIAATLRLGQVSRIADMDEVCAIERRFVGNTSTSSGDSSGKASITMDGVRQIGGLDTLPPDMQGADVNIGVIDDGIRADHIDLITRPVTLVGRFPAHIDYHHGTSCAGILCGAGLGEPQSRGLLPLSRLLFAHNYPYTEDDRYAQMARMVDEHHACVISESFPYWGSNGCVDHYEGGAEMLDEIVQRHDVLICQSIGNAAPGWGGGGSWAKNALMVGGVLPNGSLRPEDHRPVYSRGPISDGRIKPDLVHFAADVRTVSASGPRSYADFSGTNCAAPLVAGHAALACEMWAANLFHTWPTGRGVFLRKPHAATLKALLINSAVPYSIGQPDSHFTRDDQGWGRSHLGNLYAVRDRLFAVDEEVALHDHEQIEYRLQVAPGENRLRATLVWTDLPAVTTAARPLVNDLDLTLIAPDGTIYHGNYGLRQGNLSLPGSRPDRDNNVENVFLNTPQAGVWTIRVSAHRIAWSDWPQGAPRGQAFGLVVSGANPEPVKYAN